MVERDRKSDLAVMDNRLIRASYQLEETEHKLLLALIGEVMPRLEADELLGLVGHEGDFIDSSKIYSINVRDYATLYNVRLDNARVQLKHAATSLFNRQITLKETAKQRTTVLRWVQQVTFDDANDCIELMWTHEVTKYISQLAKGFTQFRLREVAKLNGIYSLRLYELLLAKYNERGGCNEIIFSLDELYFSLAVPDSFKVYAEFKRRVLLPSCKEIMRVKGWEKLGAKEGKTGKKVTSVRFYRNGSGKLFCK